MKFDCALDCLNCCTLEEGEDKKILVFPEEVSRLEGLAVELGKDKFAVIEDLVFPNVKDSTVVVATYKLYFIHDTTCAFLDKNEKRCTIHDSKPLACKAYPIAIKTVDATSKEYFLDTGCQFIEDHLEFYESIKELSEIAEVEAFLNENFPFELEAAKKLLDRLNWISLRLRQLEYLSEIEMPENGFSKEDWENALEKWERRDLTPPE
ncbi:MAG: YkgJ family cysteine cluster protein [Candidatus Hodarchaeota archaeon]